MEEQNKTQSEVVQIMEKYPREFRDIDINQLVPNPWNPNQQSNLVYESIKNSIKKHGLLQFPVVRLHVGEYQIIDGEHKWKACKELNYKTIKCLVLGNDEVEVSDDDAMALTQLLNTRGYDDPIKQARLLKELQELNPNQLTMFPYTEQELKNKLELIDFDFSKYEKEEEVKVNRNRTLMIALTEEEYEVARHALSLTGKSQSEGFMLIIKEYLEIREDISKYENKLKSGEADSEPTQ